MSCQEVPKIPFAVCRAKVASRMRWRVSSTAALRLSIVYLRGAKATFLLNEWFIHLIVDVSIDSVKSPRGKLGFRETRLPETGFPRIRGLETVWKIRIGLIWGVASGQ